MQPAVIYVQNNDNTVKLTIYLGLKALSFLGRPLGKTLWLHAPCVSQSVSVCVC